MSSNEDILRARSFYYEFLAAPFFFGEDDKRFKTWRTQLAELAENPLNEAVALAFSELDAFDFATFAREQNNVLFDYSYANVALTASFYEEGRDEGVARVRTIEILKKSPYRRDADACKNSEDYVGFIFYLMAALGFPALPLRKLSRICCQLACTLPLPAAFKSAWVLPQSAPRSSCDLSQVRSVCVLPHAARLSAATAATINNFMA